MEILLLVGLLVFAFRKKLSRCALALAVKERRRRREAVRLCREERKRRRQAERGFRDKDGDIERLAGEYQRVEGSLRVFHSWARETGTEEQRNAIATEQCRVVKARQTLDRWTREGDAVVAGSHAEARSCTFLETEAPHGPGRGGYRKV